MKLEEYIQKHRKIEESESDLRLVLGVACTENTPDERKDEIFKMVQRTVFALFTEYPELCAFACKETTPEDFEKCKKDFDEFKK